MTQQLQQLTAAKIARQKAELLRALEAQREEHDETVEAMQAERERTHAQIALLSQSSPAALSSSTMMNSSSGASASMQSSGGGDGDGEDAAIDALRNSHSAAVMEHSAELLRTKQEHALSLEAASEAHAVRKSSQIYLHKDHFAKTGSGQTYIGGEAALLKQMMRCLCCRWSWEPCWRRRGRR